MADMRLSDFRRAEAAMDGAKKEKDIENEEINQRRYLENVGAYNKYGLITVISVLAVTIALFLVIFESLWYLLLLPVIYAADRYYNHNRIQKLYNRKKDILEGKAIDNTILN